MPVRRYQYRKFSSKDWYKEIKKQNFKLEDPHALVDFGQKADRNIIRLARKLLGFRISEGTYIRVAKKKIQKAAHTHYFVQAKKKEWVVNARLSKPDIFFNNSEIRYLYRSGKKQKALDIGEKKLPQWRKVTKELKKLRNRLGVNRKFDYLIHDCQEFERILNTDVFRKLSPEKIESLIKTFQNHPFASDLKNADPFKRQLVFIGLEAVAEVESKKADQLNLEEIGKKAIDNFKQVYVLLNSAERLNHLQSFDLTDEAILNTQTSGNRVGALGQAIFDELTEGIELQLGEKIRDRILTPGKGFISESFQKEAEKPNFGAESLVSAEGKIYQGTSVALFNALSDLENFQSELIENYSVDHESTCHIFDKILSSMPDLNLAKPEDRQLLKEEAKIKAEGYFYSLQVEKLPVDELSKTLKTTGVLEEKLKRLTAESEQAIDPLKDDIEALQKAINSQEEIIKETEEEIEDLKGCLEAEKHLTPSSNPLSDPNLQKGGDLGTRLLQKRAGVIQMAGEKGCPTPEKLSSDLLVDISDKRIEELRKTIGEKADRNENIDEEMETLNMVLWAKSYHNETAGNVQNYFQALKQTLNQIDQIRTELTQKKETTEESLAKVQKKIEEKQEKISKLQTTSQQEKEILEKERQRIEVLTKGKVTEENKSEYLEEISEFLRKETLAELKKVLEVGAEGKIAPSEKSLNKICSVLGLPKEIVKGFHPEEMAVSDFANLFYRLKNLSKFYQILGVSKEGVFRKTDKENPLGKVLLDETGLQLFDFDPELFPKSANGYAKAISEVQKMIDKPYTFEQAKNYLKYYLETALEGSAIFKGRELEENKELQSDLKRSFFLSNLKEKCLKLPPPQNITFPLFLNERFAETAILPDQSCQKFLDALIRFAKEASSQGYRSSYIEEVLKDTYPKIEAAKLGNEMIDFPARKGTLFTKLEEIKKKRETIFDPNLAIENLIEDPTRIFSIASEVLSPAMGKDAEIMRDFLMVLKGAMKDSPLMEELQNQLAEFQRGPFQKMLNDSAGILGPEQFYLMVTRSFFNTIKYGLGEAVTFFEKFGEPPEKVLKLAKDTGDYTVVNSYMGMTDKKPHEQMAEIGEMIAGENWQLPLNQFSVDDYFNLNLDRKVTTLMVLPLLKSVYMARFEKQKKGRLGFELMEIETTIKDVIAHDPTFAKYAKFRGGTKLGFKFIKFLDSLSNDSISRGFGKGLAPDIIEGLDLEEESERELKEHEENIEDLASIIFPSLIRTLDEDQAIDFIGMLYDYSRGKEDVHLNEIGLSYLTILQKWVDRFETYAEQLDGGMILYNLMEEEK